MVLSLYQPLDPSKSEIRILKFRDSTVMKRNDLVHCILQTVSLNDLTPEYKAFVAEKEQAAGHKLKHDDSTKAWTSENAKAEDMICDSSVKHGMESSVGQLPSRSRPNIASWRYAVEKEPEKLLDLLGIDYTSLYFYVEKAAKLDEPAQQQPQENTLPSLPSPSPSKEIPTAFRISPRFTWGDFETISYCWESSVKERQVIVNGIVVDVPKNLEAILQKLAKLPEAASGMGFWIDGLCINQDDNVEKGYQVKLMERIYAQAFATIVWLGGAAQNSDRAMEPIALISHFAEYYKADKEYTKWYDRLPWKDILAVLNRVTLFLCGERQLPRAAIVSFTRHCRTYVSDITRVLDSRGKWDAESHESDLELSPSRVHQLLALKPGNNDSRPNIDTFLDLSSRANVTNPRDKIYGLLGLLPSWLSAKVHPNYSLTTNQVYIEFAETLIEDSKSLTEVLSWCKRSYELQTGATLYDRLRQLRTVIGQGLKSPRTSLSAQLLGGDDLPSWVPDWSKPFPGNYARWLNNQSASGSLRLPIAVKKGKKLNCHAILVDSVEAVSYTLAERLPFGTVHPKQPVPPDPKMTRNYGRYTDAKGLAEALHQTFLMSVPHAHKSASLLDIYWIDWDQLSTEDDDDDDDKDDDEQLAALSAGGMSLATRPVPTVAFNQWEMFDSFRQTNASFPVFSQPLKYFFPSMRSYKVMDTEGFKLDQRGNPQNLTLLHAYNMSNSALVLLDRRLLTTANGFLGLATDAVRACDVVAIIIGCNFPVILRPIGKNYRYIGECYVHGLMNGEAVEAVERGEYTIVKIGIV